MRRSSYQQGATLIELVVALVVFAVAVAGLVTALPISLFPDARERNESVWEARSCAEEIVAYIEEGDYKFVGGENCGDEDSLDLSCSEPPCLCENWNSEDDRDCYPVSEQGEGDPCHGVSVEHVEVDSAKDDECAVQIERNDVSLMLLRSEVTEIPGGGDKNRGGGGNGKGERSKRSGDTGNKGGNGNLQN